MKTITEQDGLQKEWMAAAQDMTLEGLPEFLRRLTEDYEHDYGTICHAIAAAAVAAARAVEKTPQGGITGFQAGAITWEIIRGWTDSMIGNHGARMQKFENLMYPQYENSFTSVPEETLEEIRSEARKRLREEDENGEDAHIAQAVLDHWRFIASGGVPFGLKVSGQ